MLVFMSFSFESSKLRHDEMTNVLIYGSGRLSPHDAVGVELVSRFDEFDSHTQTHTHALKPNTILLPDRYVDSEPLLPMEDAAFGKLLPVFDKILMTGGEDRLLQIVLGVAKDTSLTPEQAILVARMFSRQRSQELVYQQVSDLENALLPH